MLNSPLGGRRGIGFGLGRSWQRKSTNWWLAGGIDAANCVAAYQAKGAASYAASKINLVNPGTYDAIDDAPNSPQWTADRGWYNDIAAPFETDRYLRTTIQPANDQSWSAFVYAKANIDERMFVFGSVNTTGGLARFRFRFMTSVENSVWYANGSYIEVSPHATVGVFGWAGNQPYRNGVVEPVTIPAGDNIDNMPIAAFGNNANGTHYSYKVESYALAIYNTTITPAQVFALTTAMQSL